MTSVAASRPPVDRERDSILRRYGIEFTDENKAALSAHRVRTRRARWWGVVGVLVAVAVGFLGFTGESLALNIARVFGGYLLGSTAAEFFSPQRRAAGTIHAASLATRQPRSLLPLWARVVPWLFLAPCLFAPLLLLGDHPVGVTRFADETGYGSATAEWFSGPVLFTVAVLAAVALTCWQLTLRRLASRPLPIDNLGAARVDQLTRALSARTVSGTAAALGLCLMAGLAALSVPPLNSATCEAPDGCHDLYSWQPYYDLIQTSGLVAIFVAILIFWFSRLPRIDPSLLPRSVGSER